MNPEAIKIALVMMARAPLKGEEAKVVAEAMTELQNFYIALTTPQPKVSTPKAEEENGNDA